jgi:uncharacterized RDD family membrane protein YckC
METDRIEIRTPEGFNLEMTLAGIGSRAAAALVDTLIFVVLAILVLLPLNGNSLAERLIMIALPFLLFFGYHLAFETMGRRQSPGKRLLRLRVVRTDGSPAGAVASLIRNLVRIVDFMPGFYLIGAIAVFSTTQNQRLGDMAAGVVVVMEPGAVDPLVNPLPTHAELPEGWDVSAISDSDVAMMQQFLNRRESLSPEARQQIGYQIASGLEGKISRPAERMRSTELIEIVLQLKQRHH